MTPHANRNRTESNERGWIVRGVLLVVGYTVFLAVMLREALRALAGA